MLSRVLQLVHEQGWFDTGRPFEKCVYLSQGASISLLLTRGGQLDSFVKFSPLVSLATEGERCARATRCYPDHAPRFVGSHRSPPLDVLCSRAVPFRALTASTTESPADAEAVKAGLKSYFQRMRTNGVNHASLDPGRHDWLDDMGRYYTGHVLQEEARRGMRLIEAHLHELPPLPQHGDMVVNNLGLDPARRLVVFDWEDYGAVGLPGLDLFTLSYSLAAEVAVAASLGMRSHPERILDTDACCAALGMDPRLYARLQLAQALAFRYLKRNYGPEIQSRLDALVRQVSA